MGEGNFHKIWKNHLCGCNQEQTTTEKTLKSNRRLDCSNEFENNCGEVELNRYRIWYAVDKLEEAVKAGCKHPILVVKDKDIPYAQKLIQNKEISLIPASKQSEFIAKCEEIRLEDKNCDFLGENLNEPKVIKEISPHSIKDSKTKTEKLTSL